VIRPRVPLVKIVASAVTIGTGGSGGREGPIAQIGAGFGSVLGGLLQLRSAERRVLVAAGMGAGVAAIFRAPLAGALFAAEVLYRSPEFEPDVIMPAGLASVVAYCTFGAAFGWRPLFNTPRLVFESPVELIGYAALVPVVVLLAMLYTRSFYGLTAVFHRLPLPPHLKPAVGALLTGAVGVGLYFALGGQQDVLAVLSFGYGVVQKALGGPAGSVGSAIAILSAVALGKILTTGLMIGSGGSGGVFGPSMVIGGCGGGALGLTLNALWPPLAPHPASFVIVGMAGFFAAAAKTPFSTLVIVSEMTGDYNLILPALFVCTLAFLLSDEQSLYRSQVESRSRSPAHQGRFVREALTGVTIDSFLPLRWDGPALRPGDPLDAVAERFDDPGVPVLPVLDGDGRLLGVVASGGGVPGGAGRECRAAPAGGRPHAAGHAPPPRRRTGPGDGTVRRKRSAGPAGGRRRPPRHRHGPPVGRRGDLPAARPRPAFAVVRGDAQTRALECQRPLPSVRRAPSWNPARRSSNTRTRRCDSPHGRCCRSTGNCAATPAECWNSCTSTRASAWPRRRSRCRYNSWS
jgi:CIC family chloride channel protein